MPSNLSKGRLRKAFNEGRRSASSETAENPYDNAKLRQLWEQGRTKQRAGEIKTPIPLLAHGETRAARVMKNPPGSARPSRPAPRPRNPTRFGGRGRNEGRGQR